jgi:1-acyl-sn-glycerol-3-phosphate acyltransferase
MARFRIKDEERDAYFPAFRRYDAPDYSRWKLYPGAMLWMPTRFVAMWLITLTMCLFIYLFSIGHDYKEGPMQPGCRKNGIKCIYFFGVNLFLFSCGISTKKVYHDVDYSEYLGPNYLSSYKSVVKASTIVSNHVSWLDAIVLLK